MVSRVPKFIEHKMAQKRRDRKEQDGAAKPGDGSSAAYKPYDEARKRFEEKQAEKAKKMEQRSEGEKIAAQRNKERKQITKLTKKRNDRGQPNMNAQLEILMKKYTKKNSQ
jgi:hypothetical protein